jgi:hypothetical protein
MILKALYDLAQREELVPDSDFEIKPVAWVIRVGDSGRFLGIEPLKQAEKLPEGSKKKPKMLGMPKLVPKRLPSRSGKHPQAEFFVDNPLYVLGKSIPAEKYKPLVCKTRQCMFADRIKPCAEESGDNAVKDCTLFLQKHARGELEVAIPSEMKGNDLIAFSYQTEESFVHKRPAVIEYWRKVNYHRLWRW